MATAADGKNINGSDGHGNVLRVQLDSNLPGPAARCMLRMSDAATLQQLVDMARQEVLQDVTTLLPLGGHLSRELSLQVSSCQILTPQEDGAPPVFVTHKLSHWGDIKVRELVPRPSAPPTTLPDLHVRLAYQVHPAEVQMHLNSLASAAHNDNTPATSPSLLDQQAALLGRAVLHQAFLQQQEHAQEDVGTPMLMNGPLLQQAQPKDGNTGAGSNSNSHRKRPWSAVGGSVSDLLLATLLGSQTHRYSSRAVTPLAGGLGLPAPALGGTSQQATPTLAGQKQPDSAAATPALFQLTPAAAGEAGAAGAAEKLPASQTQPPPHSRSRPPRPDYRPRDTDRRTPQRRSSPGGTDDRREEDRRSPSRHDSARQEQDRSPGEYSPHRDWRRSPARAADRPTPTGEGDGHEKDGQQQPGRGRSPRRSEHTHSASPRRADDRRNAGVRAQGSQQASPGQGAATQPGGLGKRTKQGSTTAQPGAGAGAGAAPSHSPLPSDTHPQDSEAVGAVAGKLIDTLQGGHAATASTGTKHAVEPQPARGGAPNSKGSKGSKSSQAPAQAPVEPVTTAAVTVAAAAPQASQQTNTAAAQLLSRRKEAKEQKQALTAPKLLAGTQPSAAAASGAGGGVGMRGQRQVPSVQQQQPTQQLSAPQGTVAADTVTAHTDDAQTGSKRGRKRQRQQAASEAAAATEPLVFPTQHSAPDTQPVAGGSGGATGASDVDMVPETQLVPGGPDGYALEEQAPDELPHKKHRKSKSRHKEAAVEAERPAEAGGSQGTADTAAAAAAAATSPSLKTFQRRSSSQPAAGVQLGEAEVQDPASGAVAEPASEGKRMGKNEKRKLLRYGKGTAEPAEPAAADAEPAAAQAGVNQQGPAAGEGEEKKKKKKRKKKSQTEAEPADTVAQEPAVEEPAGAPAEPAAQNEAEAGPMGDEQRKKKRKKDKKLRAEEEPAEQAAPAAAAAVPVTEPAETVAHTQVTDAVPAAAGDDAGLLLTTKQRRQLKKQQKLAEQAAGEAGHMEAMRPPAAQAAAAAAIARADAVTVPAASQPTSLAALLVGTSSQPQPAVAQEAEADVEKMTRKQRRKLLTKLAQEQAAPPAAPAAAAAPTQPLVPPSSQAEATVDTSNKKGQGKRTGRTDTDSVQAATAQPAKAMPEPPVQTQKVSSSSSSSSESSSSDSESGPAQAVDDAGPEGLSRLQEAQAPSGPSNSSGSSSSSSSSEDSGSQLAGNAGGGDMQPEQTGEQPDDGSDDSSSSSSSEDDSSNDSGAAGAADAPTGAAAGSVSGGTSGSSSSSEGDSGPESSSDSEEAPARKRKAARSRQAGSRVQHSDSEGEGRDAEPRSKGGDALADNLKDLLKAGSLETLLMSQPGLELNPEDFEEDSQPDFLDGTQAPKEEAGKKVAGKKGAKEAAKKVTSKDPIQGEAWLENMDPKVATARAAGLSMDLSAALPKNVGPLRQQLKNHLREYISAMRVKNNMTPMSVLRFNPSEKPDWWPRDVEYSNSGILSRSKVSVELLYEKLKAATADLMEDLYHDYKRRK